MFVFWGDGSQASMDLVNSIRVRSTENFNWTFIFILAVVFYIYWTEIHKKNTEAVCAGLALYGVHWLYEICNAIIAHVAGYPLWSVSNESTTFILLIGVCWELSMMFSIAGIISFKMLPHDRTKRYFSKNGKGGISCKLVGALEMALLFALFESFLAGTTNQSFIWVYKWWGVHHDVYPVLPREQLRAGYGAEEEKKLPALPLGPGCAAAGHPDSPRRHLMQKQSKQGTSQDVPCFIFALIIRVESRSCRYPSFFLLR